MREVSTIKAMPRQQPPASPKGIGSSLCSNCADDDSHGNHDRGGGDSSDSGSSDVVVIVE